jgi:hypothetical protein
MKWSHLVIGSIRTMVWGLIFGTLNVARLAHAESSGLPEFDFTRPAGAAGWTAAHDISRLEPTSEGLRVSISGEDPYFVGPAVHCPVGQPLWLLIRLKSDPGGMAQVFYFTRNATEEASVRFDVPRGRWTEARLPLPALGPNYRLRIDPPGAKGTCTVSRLSIETRTSIKVPVWPRPNAPTFGADALSVSSGDLSLVHARDRWGAFELRVNDHRMAVGYDQSLVGYAVGAEQRWFALTNRAEVTRVGEGIQVRWRCLDPEGGHWRFTQSFQGSSRAGGIDVISRVVVDQDRAVIHLPLLTLLPGLGSFGTNKSQALLAGIAFVHKV